METKEDGPGTKIIRRLLGKKLRCVISDGRVFFGTLYVIDFEKNLILQSATEWASIDSPETLRLAGLVMIPGEHLVSCDVETNTLNFIQKSLQ
jgi:N-alpha-acetyltransferase 38, NatC auxiliary subunit